MYLSCKKVGNPCLQHLGNRPKPQSSQRALIIWYSLNLGQRGSLRVFNPPPWLSWCFKNIPCGRQGKKTGPRVPAEEGGRHEMSHAGYKGLVWPRPFFKNLFHFPFPCSLGSGSSDYSMGIDSGILITQLKFPIGLLPLYASLPICKMMMLFFHPRNKEALLGVPGLPPAPHSLPAGLQMRNINNTSSV